MCVYGKTFVFLNHIYVVATAAVLFRFVKYCFLHSFVLISQFVPQHVTAGNGWVGVVLRYIFNK